MTAIEERLTELLHERAAHARPEPDLPAVLEGPTRVSIVADRTQQARTLRWTLGIAAAVVLVGITGVVVLERHSTSTIPVGSDLSEISYPEQVPVAEVVAPDSAPRFGALAASSDGTGLVGRDNADITGPLFAADPNTPEASPWKTWPISGQTLTDVDTSPAALYIATCCTPNGTIWRNGPAEAEGTRIDYVLDGVVRATVDPATSTARIGDSVLSEPGVLDVSLLDRRSAVLLVGQPTPRLVVLTFDDFSATALPARRVIDLPTGPGTPCAIVALAQGVLVLAGQPLGLDSCVSDRGFIVDPTTGAVVTTFLLPAPVRGINSDHAAHVIAVTTEGDVVIGAFDPPATEPRWSTVLEGDYLTAWLRKPT
jgi:hypothetical protein